MPFLELGLWYVVYSKPHREEVAQFYLQRKGLTVFFPRLLLPQPFPKRPQIVPLFPNYLFVQVRVPVEYDSVRWSPGVKCVVNFNGTPVTLDEEIVTFLRQRATPAGVLTARSVLMVGQAVGVISEPCAKLVSIVQNPHASRGRVRVLLQLLSR